MMTPIKYDFCCKPSSVKHSTLPFFLQCLRNTNVRNSTDRIAKPGHPSHCIDVAESGGEFDE